MTVTYANLQTVPVAAVPSQSLSATLGGQSVGLNIYTCNDNVYMDVYLAGALVIGGVLCQHGNQIIRNAYFGFIGDFAWWDTEGTEDPVYTGLGDRWVLVYYS